MTRLLGAFEKLDRADEHTKTLRQEIDRWTGKKPYSVSHEDNPDKTERRYHVLFDEPADVLRWGVLVGDVVHNLRSALDHIAWQCAGGDGVAPEHTEFPIFKDRDRFLKETKPGGLWKIDGIRDERHRTLIEESQPWRNRNGYEVDALWILHEFNREDKHRVLTPIVLIPLEIGFPEIEPIYATVEEARNAPPPIFMPPPSPSLHDGAEIFTVACSIPFVDMKMKAEITIGIALEYAGGYGATNTTLTELAKRTRGIAEQFRNAGV